MVSLKIGVIPVVLQVALFVLNALFGIGLVWYMLWFPSLVVGGRILINLILLFFSSH